MNEIKMIVAVTTTT